MDLPQLGSPVAVADCVAVAVLVAVWADDEEDEPAQALAVRRSGLAQGA